MKHLKTLILILLAVVLVTGTGYLGFSSAQGSGDLDSLLSAVGLRSRQAQASPEPPAPLFPG